MEVKLSLFSDIKTLFEAEIGQIGPDHETLVLKRGLEIDKSKIMNKELVVKCLHCKKSFKYYTSEFRPFCCEKCKFVDMGHWFDESYVVEGRNHTVYIEEPEKLAKLMDDENYL